MKRYLLLFLMVCIAAAAFANGQSQGSGSTAKTSSGFPNRSIDVIVPGHPGTGVDTTLRAITPTLEKYLGVPVVVVNEPAGDGEIALTRVAKNVRPDGYTWCYHNIVSVASRTTVGNLKNVFDSLTDYVYVGVTYIDPAVIVAQKNGPFKNLDDLVKSAKTNPGKISYGRGGVNSVEGIIASDLESMAGITLNTIDAMGGSNGRVAVMGGHLDLVGDNLSGSLQAYLDNGIEFLGIGGDSRAPEAPNIPTFREQGYNFRIELSERAFFGPSKIDKEIQDFFRDALKKACEDPEYIARCKEINLRGTYKDADMTLKDMQGFIDAFKAME
jgi:tripartite-type tricarboxylate transporter receptor subunit TctC